MTTPANHRREAEGLIRSVREHGTTADYAVLAVAEAVLDLADALRAHQAPPEPPVASRGPAKPAPTDVCTCGHTRAEHHLPRGYPHAPCRVIGCACLDYEAAP